jgi:hypothetical protein
LLHGRLLRDKRRVLRPPWHLRASPAKFSATNVVDLVTLRVIVPPPV